MLHTVCKLLHVREYLVREVPRTIQYSVNNVHVLVQYASGIPAMTDFSYVVISSTQITQLPTETLPKCRAFIHIPKYILCDLGIPIGYRYSTEGAN